MRRRGLNAQQIMLACEQEIQAQCGGGLSAAEFAAVRDPTSKRNAETLERMLAKGIAERDNLIGDIAMCTFDRVGPRHRKASNLYVRDYDDIRDLVRDMENRIWLNGTNHNEGFDQLLSAQLDRDEKYLYLDGHQTKAGNTPIGCANGATNANSSMVHIASGMNNAIDHIADVVEELYGYEVFFRCYLDTTRRVTDGARKLAGKESIAVNGADELWPIWQAPVREAAIAVHGAANAKTLGVPR